jgi:hypothetical protein
MNNILSLSLLESIYSSTNFGKKSLFSEDFSKKNEIKDLVFFISINHLANKIIWDEEDLARRDSVESFEIVKNKRTIDKYNQIRNNSIEFIDEIILSNFSKIKVEDNAVQNSETAGSILDRLSILTLKSLETVKQIKRPDADINHINLCKNRIEVLLQQRLDLFACLDNLLIKCSEGKSFYKVYRQFKMYNDPKFNPNIKR